jgi:histone-lysine N-methyltransferase SETMAR
MASVLWDSGLINVYFLSHDVTVSSLLCNDVHQVIQRKIPGKLSKIILLQDNTRPHTKKLTKVTLATIGWEIMKHPPCSSDLAPSDFHLFGPMKVHLGGQKFETRCPELATQSR